MLDITRILTVSTAHITEEMSKRLDRNGETDELGVTVYKYEFGYIIWCYSDMHDLMQNKNNTNEELYPLLELAQQNDCCWLRLDSDGDIVDSLPVYDW